MFKRLDPFGNPNVGVYVRATSAHLFVPPGLTDLNVTDLEQALGMKSIQLTIGGSELVGSLVAANKNGAVVADFASDREIQVLEEAGLTTIRLEVSRLNAAGNNVLCNDHGALVHPDLTAKAMKAVEDALDVPVQRGAVAGLPTVGTAAIATNRGVLCHPLASEAELAFIKKCLNAPARIGTVNHGHGLVGAGIAANQNGVACGSKTTGIELGRIDEALGT
ncbi:MAG TPA: translation initiation factor IF-6 [Candidatus Thermoplasmatota archaeon]|nr:translation initiation factor IF-6 [Candidatus Thermoplasmatota archaeon]